MMLSHIFAVASIFVGLALAAPGGVPHKPEGGIPLKPEGGVADKSFGKHSKSTRIVGGTDAVVIAGYIDKVPWHVGIVFLKTSGGHDGPFCGGTIVSEYHIITAAHCMGLDQTKGKYAVILGTVDIRSQNFFEVEKFHNHPDYNARTMNADISVLKLAQENLFEWSLPANLVHTHKNLAGKDAIVSGWGLDAFNNGVQPRTLQTIVRPIPTMQYCMEQWRPYYFDRDLKLCMPGDKTAGVFRGDSGGGLVLFEENWSSDLLGVVSYGHISDRSKPAVFTRVSAYMKWILNIMCTQDKSYYCPE